MKYLTSYISLPDKSWRNIEIAYVLLNAQLTDAKLSEVSNSQRGTYDFKEITFRV